MSMYVRCRDKIVGILMEMTEFHHLTDIIPLIGNYISNGQRLLLQYKSKSLSPEYRSGKVSSSGSNTNNDDRSNDSFMIAVQLSFSLSSSSITTNDEKNDLKCDVQHLGALPSNWDGCPLIIANASASHSSSSGGHDRHSSSSRSTIIYARSRPTIQADPDLVSWNIDTNQLTKEAAPLLLQYYDSLATVIDQHLIFFGTLVLSHLASTACFASSLTDHYLGLYYSSMMSRWSSSDKDCP
jgi:hypothetical protein